MSRGRLLAAALAAAAAIASIAACRRSSREPEVAGHALDVAPASARAAEPVDPTIPQPNRAIGVGDSVPDFSLTDQSGVAVRLSQYRGEPVGVTFLYTSCPDINACPMTTARFSRLDAMLREKKFGHLLVVTVDPEHDTPAVLKQYAEKAGADSKRWSFLTGEPAAVAEVASRFGVLYMRKDGRLLHQQAVAVVDSDGKLAAIYYGENWEPEQLLRDMEKARKG